MKNLLLIPVILIFISSCMSIHNGTLSSSSTGRNVTYNDIAFGIAETHIFLGIGGLKHDALVLEAKRQMTRNRPLERGEEYANYTVDFDYTLYLLGLNTKVTVCADVIKFTPDTLTDIYSSSYYSKLFIESKQNDLFAIGDSVIFNENNKGIIQSLIDEGTFLVLCRDPNNILTQKVSSQNIYSLRKEYRGYKLGDSFPLNGNNRSSAIIVGFGLYHILLKVTGGGIVNYREVSYK